MGDYKYKKEKVYNKKLPRKSKEFRDMQQEWYAKLKDEGFRDIEYVSPHTGHEEVGYFKVADASKDMLRTLGQHGADQRLKFWRAMSNYLQHNEEWYTLLDIKQPMLVRRYKYVAEKFVDGMSYRGISKAWKKEWPKRKQFSYFIVFQIVRDYMRLALKWNEEHEEGLLLDDDFEENIKGEV